MQGILYEEPSFLLFALVTVLMGGWAAWMTGRAMAKTWSGPGLLVFYLLLLTAAVRFIHYALFDGTLFSLHYILVDGAVLLAVGLVGYRYTRTTQMVTQYAWLYERAGPFAWRARRPPSGAAQAPDSDQVLSTQAPSKVG